MNGRAIRVALVAVSLAGGPAIAHHSIGMIEISSPVWLTATVVRYEPRDPHVLIHVEERRPDGSVKPWTLEGPIMSRLDRMNLARDFLKPGETIEVCGFPFTKQVIAQNAAANLQPLPALHAHLLVLRDGKRQPWGPYGKLDNCVRPGDTVQMWVDLIDHAPMAREYWCKGMAHSSVASVAPKALVDAVNGRLAMPCD